MQTSVENKPKKPNMRLGFATPEHKAAGDAVTLRFIAPNGTVKPLNNKLTMFSFNNSQPVRSNLVLSYGDIIALYGDYFSAAQPISTQKDEISGANCFIDGFNQLANSRQPIISEVFDINKKSYVKNDTLNGYIQQIMLVFTLGKKYFDNTNDNLDHFYEWSIIAYNTGHQVALQMAKKGHEMRQMGDFEAANQYLNLAYQMNAAAGHYLSDTYAAGHLRELSLRQQLSARFGLIGGILVNNMHNEDNTLGVKVSNQAGDHWVAYGDENYNRAENATNRQMINKTLQASADEIFTTYQTGLAPEKSQVTNYLPKVDPVNNNAPLFKSINDKIYYRDPLQELNPSKTSYKELGFFSALALTMKLRLFSSWYTPHYTPEANKQPANTGVSTKDLLPKIACNPSLAPCVNPPVKAPAGVIAVKTATPAPNNNPVLEAEVTPSYAF